MGFSLGGFLGFGGGSSSSASAAANNNITFEPTTNVNFDTELLADSYIDGSNAVAASISESNELVKAQLALGAIELNQDNINQQKQRNLILAALVLGGGYYLFWKKGSK